MKQLSQFKPKIITKVPGSHCLVMLFDEDIYLDAEIESPGYTRLKVVVDGTARLVINTIPDEDAPEQIIQLIREYARDARG